MCIRSTYHVPKSAALPLIDGRLPDPHGTKDPSRTALRREFLDNSPRQHINKYDT
jgi:hypothetical protein